MLNISEQELGFMYKILESAVTSGQDTDKAYQLKMKIISILKTMQANRVAQAAPETPAAPKVEAEVVAPEVSKDTLDMK